MDRELNMGSYGANSNSNVHYSLYAISNHMGESGTLTVAVEELCNQLVTHLVRRLNCWWALCGPL